MTNTIYACCLSTYLRISTAAALTISTHIYTLLPSHQLPHQRRAQPPLHSATLARLSSHPSQYRGGSWGRGLVCQCSVTCHVSRVTCHDVVTHGSMWDSSLTSAAEKEVFIYWVSARGGQLWHMEWIWSSELSLGHTLWRPGRKHSRYTRNPDFNNWQFHCHHHCDFNICGQLNTCEKFFDIHSVNIVALYIKYFWQM